MCGIFGYVGAPAPVDRLVLGALRSMEYRGYDSWGLAYVDAEHGRVTAKGVGRVPASVESTREATSAIGHTRWATHGAVTERNAHPHLSSDGRVAIVHNGIIENAGALTGSLGGGVALASDTDSEVMAHLVSQRLNDGMALREAVTAAFAPMEGSNAFVVLNFVTGEVVVITHRMPIRIWRVGDRVMLASDPGVFSGQAESILVLPDDVAVSLGRPGVLAESLLHLERTGEWAEVLHEADSARAVGPGGAMRAEIADQPLVLHRLATTVDVVQEAARLGASARRVVFTGCGSAFHAAWWAAERLAACGYDERAVAVPAAELPGRAERLRTGDVVVALTQSGETADVIDALVAARERDATTIGIVNVPGSSVARMVDLMIPLYAGIERSVLATKSLMAMLGRVSQVTEAMARIAGEISVGGDLRLEAEMLSRAMTSERADAWVRGVATALAPRSSVMVLGMGEHLPIASEAALKIKEGTYVHAEVVRVGELKHGVIALVDDGFPCLLMTGVDDTPGRLSIAAAELRSRGATVFTMSRGSGHLGSGDIVAASPFEQTLLVQRVALETALLRGVDPDYPRNLAKSVTVR